MPSYFKNLRSPAVIKQIDIYSFLDEIENPNSERKEAVLKAREFYNAGNKKAYESLKKQLPCVTINFTFDDWKNNNNIIDSTGFIYIDVDGTTEIDLSNSLIFASWLSLSGSGRGVLVKVKNLSSDNFKDCYESISNELGIQSDSNAAKATQFTVISYDTEVYINNDSRVWVAKDVIKNTPISISYKEKKKKDATEMGVNYNSPIVYNNIGDYDFGEKEYLFFPDEKEVIAKLWIPRTIILNGARNNTISAIAYQIRALNPHLSIDRFKSFVLKINRSRCVEPLSDNEVLQIVIKIEKESDLEPISVTPRRVIFSPKSKLDAKAKRSITNKLTGRLRSERTVKELIEVVKKWNFKELGKITQRKLAEVSGRNIKTIEKYYRMIKCLDS